MKRQATCVYKFVFLNFIEHQAQYRYNNHGKKR